MMDALIRTKQAPDGHQAAVIALSQLQPEFRRMSLVQRAAELFLPLMHAAQGALEVFLPDSLDIVIVGKSLPRDRIKATAGQVRTLFGADPLARERAAGRDRFARWFDLARPDHLTAFATLADDIDKRSMEAAQAKGAWNINDQPLTPKRLALLISDMEGLDIPPLLQRQAVVSVGGDKRAAIVFEEFFVSIAALRKKVASQVDLLSDRWLFQDLSRALDRHILRHLRSILECQHPTSISVNLNLESLTSDAFAGFARSLKEDQTLLVEVGAVDVFADIGAFLRGRDMLHAQGCKLIIDGLTPRTLETVDLGQLGADHYKLAWNNGFVASVDGDDAAAARALIGAIGAERMILTRTDSEHAVGWGLKAGIRAFQGYFIDSMLGAMVLDACQMQDKCSLGKCIAARRALAGPLRNECRDLKALDSTTRIAARRRA